MSHSDSDLDTDPKAEFPDYRRSVRLSNVKQGYTLLCKHALTLVFVPIAAGLTIKLWKSLHTGELENLINDASQTRLKLDLLTLCLSACLLSIILAALLFFRTRPVYLVDFSVYKPPAWHFGAFQRHVLPTPKVSKRASTISRKGRAPVSAKVSHDLFKALSRISKKFDEPALAFQEKIIERSGLGDETYLPHAVRSRPPVISMANARKEAEMVMFGAVRDVLQKTGLRPEQISVLVVNCSLFNPTPSLAAMIINHFRMRHDIVHYNLAGMGCSAGLISIDLASKMLQIHNNAYALVVSTENITQNWYFGNSRSMLLPNCLFRMGCSAVVLSNHYTDGWRAKYQLQCPVIRTMTGGMNDAAYNCIFQMEDEYGNKGVKLTKELMGEAGRALKQNITTLGPLVLPFSEQLLFLFNVVARKALGMKVKPYIPDFRLAFEHFCIHTGGRAVIEEIEKQLRLTRHLVKPSKDTLYRYGNISSSSIWYILANIETTKGMRRGERVWQIGFGSGFKCNSAVWKALRTQSSQHPAWLDKVEMETDPKYIDNDTYETLRAENGTAGDTSLAAQKGA